MSSHSSPVKNSLLFTAILELFPVGILLRVLDLLHAAGGKRANVIWRDGSQGLVPYPCSGFSFRWGLIGFPLGGDALVHEDLGFLEPLNHRVKGVGNVQP